MSSIAVSTPPVHGSSPAAPAHPFRGGVREYRVERAEGTSAVRGLAIGVLLSLPLWAMIIGGGNVLLSALV